MTVQMPLADFKFGLLQAPCDYKNKFPGAVNLFCFLSFGLTPFLFLTFEQFGLSLRAVLVASFPGSLSTIQPMQGS